MMRSSDTALTIPTVPRRGHSARLSRGPSHLRRGSGTEMQSGRGTAMQSGLGTAMQSVQGTPGTRWVLMPAKGEGEAAAAGAGCPGRALLPHRSAARGDRTRRPCERKTPPALFVF